MMEGRCKYSVCDDASTRCAVVVFSPLIALMRDQVSAMERRNVSAVYTGEADDKTESNILLSNYQLVFVSPEGLLTDDRWCDMLMNPVYPGKLVDLMVDEAHCVKKQ